MEEELRAFYFGNFYLSSLAQGIQALHATTEMFMKYKHHTYEHDMLESWARDHKTVILLNGGMGRDLTDLQSILHDCPFPWAPFKESFDALNGANTSVGILLPESVYSKRISSLHKIVQNHGDDFSVVKPNGDIEYENMEEWELKFVTFKSNCGLAK